jgi:hypothetical protein
MREPPEAILTERSYRLGIGVLLFMTVLIAYIETMAASASFWDSGEFIVAAYILGIPHPPATPLYVVLGRVFTMMPLPLTIAQKINFMSALFGALGIVMLFYLMVHLIRERRGEVKTWLDRVVVYGSALVGALFTAWSNTYWSNSIEAEVYSISSFVMGGTTLLALRWARNPQAADSTRSIYLIIYLLSLGVGFHLGTVLTYPAIAAYLLLFRKKSFKDADLLIFTLGFFLFLAHVNLKFAGPWALLVLLVFLALLVVRTVAGKRFVLITTGLFALGLSIHLLLYIRSNLNPALDEADPETWDRLLAVLRREQYPPSDIFARKATWHFQIVEHFWRYCTEQYELVKNSSGFLSGARLSLIPILVGVSGMVAMAMSKWRTFVLVFGTFIITSAGMIVFLNFSDAEVRERDYFYSPAFYFFGAFIGVGLAALVDWFFITKRKLENLSILDRAGAVAAVLIFLMFTGMLYQRYHFEHDRSNEWVPWGYGYNMLVALEPNAVIFTNGDNDTFPLWFQQEVEHFRKDVRVINLSLLNTTWYPRQLRDQEPIVKLDWTDEDIINLPQRSRDLYFSSDGKQALQPRDFAVRQVVRDNFNDKPIYFAVTIPPETIASYKDHLILEGVVYRLVREQGDSMRDFEKMADNVDNVYSFRGILTEDGQHDYSVYRDVNQKTLIQNYSGSFIRLGQHEEELAVVASSAEVRQRHVEQAIGRYKTAHQISPQFETLSLLLGTVYQENERFAEARAHFESELREQPDNDRFRFELGRTLLMMQENDPAIEALRAVARNTPEDEFLWQYLVYTLWEIGRPQEADRMIREWEAHKDHIGNTRLREFYNAAQQGVISFPSDVPGSQAPQVPLVAPGTIADSMAGTP